MKTTTLAAIIAVAGSLSARTETVTEAQMLDMATRAATFTDTYSTVPQIIYTDTDQTSQTTAAEFYYMMARWIRYVDDHGTTPATVTITRNTAAPTSPTGVEAGTIQQADMLASGSANADFIDTNSRVPNYTVIGSTTYSPESYFYAMARTIRWYSNNGSLPNYTTVTNTAAPDSWTGPGGQTNNTPPPQYPWSKSFTVAYTAQPDAYTCGPTSLRMAMGYYGTWYGVGTISSYMGSIGDSPYNDGVGRSTILSAAHHYGFSGAVDTTGWDNLKTAIQNNKPCITHMYISPGNYPLYYPSGNAAYTVYNGGHYMVTCGLHADSNGYVDYAVVNDPARGQAIKYSGLSFQSSWGYNSYHFIKLN